MDFTHLTALMGRFYQIRDDYMNLQPGEVGGDLPVGLFYLLIIVRA